LLETLFGLAREGHVNKRGMPHPLQLAPIARRLGYRATYPSLSRTTLAPRVKP
jgi:hypothetical protein